MWKIFQKYGKISLKFFVEYAMKILICCPRGRTFDTFFDEKNIKYLQSLGEVVWNPYGCNFTNENVGRFLGGCDVYVGAWGAPRLDGALLEYARDLRVVIHLGGNAQMLAGEEVWNRGIKVLSGEKFYAASAAEGTLAYTLSILRRIPEYSTRFKYKSEWRHTWDENTSLMGKTVGIINYSRIADEFARLLQPFAVKLLVYDKIGVPKCTREKFGLQCVTFEELLRNSDVVTVHTPRHMDYYHMINYEQISQLKKGAVLIDTSIGGVVNTNALFISLLNERISAVTDVYEYEPPRVDRSLLYLNNLILMPHMAGATPEIRAFVARKLLEECVAFINHGIPPEHEVKEYREYRDLL